MYFLHCADLHIGSPFRGLSPLESAERRKKQLNVLDSIIEYAVNNKIRLVLLAGDVFENEFIPVETVKTFFMKLMAYPSISFVIAPGNHDPFTENGFYSGKYIPIPENVFIFSSHELSCFSFPFLGVNVYGFAFTGPRMSASPRLTPDALDASSINVLLCHGDLDTPNSVYCPLSTRELALCGYDYVALGHIHSWSAKKSDGTYIAYSGCTEGRDFGEAGDKGIFRVEIDKDRSVIETSFHSTAKTRYEIIDAVVTGFSSNSDISDLIRGLISGVSPNAENTALRINLIGSVPEGFIPDKAEIQSLLGGFAHVEIFDGTVWEINRNELEHDMSIRGGFYRSLKDKLESDDENIRKIAELAFRYGMNALNGVPVINENDI